MSEVARRNARNRGAGKRWEKEIEVGGRAVKVDTERTRDTGTKDQGDEVMRIDGKYVVIEAKNAAFQPAFWDEAAVEAKHFAEFRNLDAERVYPVVFLKRRGKGFLDSLAVVSIREYLRLQGVRVE